MIKVALLVASLSCIDASGYGKQLAINEKDLIDIQKKNLQELQCFRRLDDIIASKWVKDFKKLISNKDYGNAYSRPYYFLEGNNRIPIAEAWLELNNTTTEKIDSCFRSVVQEVVPLLKPDDISCLNELFDSHMRREITYDNINKKVLKKDLREQLPFRKHLSFAELVELVFQNKNPDALGWVEKLIYEKAEKYIKTEKDKLERTFLIQNDCSWRDVRTLFELSNLTARLDEFSHLVIETVNKRVAHFITEYWDVYKMFPHNEYMNWVEARQNMTSELKEEVEKLRDQKKDAQWLCNYAAELGYKFALRQMKILWIPPFYAKKESFDERLTVVYYPSVKNLMVADVMFDVKRIEENLNELRDVRHPVLKKLQYEYLKKAACFSAFYNAVKNHQRFNIASLVSNNRYSYWELYCRDQAILWNEITVDYCKCVGSLCIRYFLPPLTTAASGGALEGVRAYLNVAKYHLQLTSNGTYRVTHDDM